MIEDFEDDTHFCLKCHSTIIGLDNYVNHRKTTCGKITESFKSPLSDQLIAPDEPFALKADDFFSSLELQSSSKKVQTHSTSGKSFGVLTRSKTAGIQATCTNKEQSDANQSKSGKNVWIGGDHLKELDDADNETKLIKAVDNLEQRKEEPATIQAYEASDDESVDFDYDDDEVLSDDEDAPPRNYTGGKWKPTSPVPWNWSNSYSSYTGCKWKPLINNKAKWKPRNENDNEYSADVPPANYTKGKWKPMNESQDYPPANYTKGKWKPKSDNDSDIPSPSHTKGKWKPKSEIEEESKPPIKVRNVLKDLDIQPVPGPSKVNPVKKTTPITKEKDDLKMEIEESTSYTKPKQSFSKGKWYPQQETSPIKLLKYSPLRKSSGMVQYWCNSCNRRLASKVVYERHLKSELHFKRSLQEREFDDGVNMNMLSDVKSPELIFSNEELRQNIGRVKKRRRKKLYERCGVCQSKVNLNFMGKHLISHYHCRKGNINSSLAKSMVLENILDIVLQSPFQCSVCKFYCNTVNTFNEHWKSKMHLDSDKEVDGYYSCSFCKIECNTTDEMFTHLSSPEHVEVVSVINRSVPIIIQKITPKACLTCNEKFVLNIELLHHCREHNHDISNVALNVTDFICQHCNAKFSSNIVLQRHLKKVHKEKCFTCSICLVKFKDVNEAKLHKSSEEHKFKVAATKSAERRCDYCTRVFGNIFLYKQHIKEEHSQHMSKCPHCGETFGISQDLTVHLREKLCKFEENLGNCHSCTKCLYSTNSTSEMLFHEALHDDPIKIELENKKPSYEYKCQLCGKFFSKSSLEAHLRNHTKELPFECNICHKKFARKNNWVVHEKNHGKKNRVEKVKPVEGERPFLCSTCGASFGKKSILQQHMQIHTGKLCKCPYPNCIYTARKISEIKQHYLYHTDIKQFCCTLCDYAGKTKRQLNRHMTVHETIKKYKCPHCSFSARISGHLKRHVRLHTGSKPYSCPHCKYKCVSIENLRKHILSTNKHQGKSIYLCKFCNEDHFQTNFAKDFKVHLVTQHAEMFASSIEASTYVAGIFDMQADSTYLNDFDDMEVQPSDNSSSSNPAAETRKIERTNYNIMTLKTDVDPIVSQSYRDKNLDEMLPMYVISKEEIVNAENSDSWNLVGRYDVEESGVLVPFQSVGDTLFQEHFQ